MSNSTYVSLKPVYNTAGSAERPNNNTSAMSKLNPASDAALKSGNLRAIPATDENPAFMGNKLKKTINAFKNDIYDNVNIDVSPPDENEDGFCAFDDEKENKGNEGAAKNLKDDADKKFKVDTDKNLKDDAMEFVNGITKKQWLWAGGITAGFLILKNRK
jgi:hypothetical protein